MIGKYVPAPFENTTFTEPGPGDALDAASVRCFLEGLSDSLAWKREGGGELAANWEDAAVLTYNGKRFAFSDYDQVWASTSDGGIDQLETTSNFGRTWDDRVALLGSGKVLVDAAFDANGNLVIVTGTRDTYVLTRSAYATWTGALTSNALSAAPSGGALAFQPEGAGGGLFVACYRVGATGMRLDTSNGGTAWTARALPAGWATYGGANNPEIGVGGGRTIALFADSPPVGTVEIAYSLDGSTWAGVTLTSACTASPVVTRPVYDDVRGEWYFAISATGTGATEIWRSTDGGATWAIALTFTGSIVLTSLCLLGRALVAVTKEGEVIASGDAGATWKLVHGNAGTASVTRIRSGGGGALLVNATDKTCRVSKRAAIGRTIA